MILFHLRAFFFCRGECARRVGVLRMGDYGHLELKGEGTADVSFGNLNMPQGISLFKSL